MVNINVCMTAFYTPGNLAQAMDAFQSQTGGAMPSYFAERLKISTKHLGYTRKYTIHKVMTSLTARSHRFDCQEMGGQVTVEQYFKKSKLHSIYILALLSHAIAEYPTTKLTRAHP